MVVDIEGHAEAPYPWFARPILAAIGVALLWPSHIMINVAGTALLVAFMVWNIRTARHLAASR